MTTPYTITNPATTAPVTIDAARRWLRVDDAEEDTLITELIGAASDWAAREFGGVLIESGIEELFPGFPCCNACPIELSAKPVKEVTTVQYKTTSGSWVPLSPAIYELDGSAILLLQGNDWPTDLATVAKPVKVTYVAGFPENQVPPTIATAMLLMIGFWYENREDISINETNNPRIRSARNLIKSCKIY